MGPLGGGLVQKSGTKVIQQSPDVLSGTRVFAKTRVPIKTLFDYLAAGDNVTDFLDDFPSVRPAQVKKILLLTLSET